MSSYDDDQNVSGQDVHDIVTMSMARRTLRSLVPETPPTPSEELALVLRAGLAAPAATGSRIAGLGIAAKLMLAAGVAVASAGGAATAVAFTHDTGHHGDGTDSPRNHPVAAVPSPTGTGSSTVASDPTAHPTTFGTAGSGGHDGGRSDDGNRSDGQSDGSQDSGSGDSSGSGSSGSGDSGSSSSSQDSGSSSGDGSGSTSTSGDSSGSTSSGSTSSGSTSSGSTSSGSDGGGGSGSSDGGSGDASPSPSPTTDR
jgi:hypothetical protein